MDTDNDIEVQDLRDIETSLGGEKTEPQSSTNDAASGGFLAGSAGAFLVT